MREFSNAWREIKSEEIVYPNGVKAKEVFENISTNARIVRRYNQLGSLIYSNEKYINMKLWKTLNKKRAKWLSSFFTPNTWF